MIRTILICALLVFGWSSAEVRLSVSNALRLTASVIEPDSEFEENPKFFKIPNPFYFKGKNHSEN